jgi:hypothetical protein
MIRMFAACAIAVLALTAPLAAPARAAAPANVMGYSQSDLSGEWEGVYFSGGQVAPFSAMLVQDGDGVFGSMTEPAVFGDGQSAFLLSDVMGTVRGARITFEKTYNGVGGQTHTVRYQGTISRDGRRITGTWTLEGMSDRFEMVR